MSPAVLLCWVCLGPVVFGGMLPVSSDLYGYAFQVGLQLRHAYLTGELPFWSPNSLLGAPFLADPQSAVFYPPNILLYWLLPTADALRATLVVHILTAYLGTYGFLRSIGLGRPASMYGAISYAFSGYVLYRIASTQFLMVACLLPVLFFLGHAALRARTFSHQLLYTVAFAAGIALDVLMGFAQGTYYTLLAVSVYMAATAIDKHALASPRALLTLPRTLALRLGLPMLIGVAVCAVQLLPTLEFVRWSNRSGLAGTPGIPIGQTVEGLSPSTVWGVLGAGPVVSEQWSFYTGALGLPLAVLALVLRVNRRSLFFAVSAILTVLLVTELRNPIRDLASFAIPGWTAFEDHLPIRALVYVVFCLVVLAAWAIDRPLPTMRWLPVVATLELSVILTGIGRWPPVANLLQAIPTQVRLAVVFLGLNVLLVSTWRTTWLRRWASRLAVPAMLAVLLVDLAFHFRAFGMQYHRLPEAFGPSASANFLLSRSTEPWRFLSMTRAGMTPYQDLGNAPTLLSANSGVVYGLEDAQGYNPLQLSHYREFLAAVNGAVKVDYHVGSVLNPFSPLFRYLNTRFLVTDASVPLTAQLAGQITLDAGRPEARLATSTRPLRGLVVDSWLGNSTNVPQGTAVAAITVVGPDGTSTRFTLRAGVETAEWAYDSPIVRPLMQHERPAAIPRKVPWASDHGNIYRATFSLSEPTAINELRFELLAPQVTWIVDQVSSDSETWRDLYEIAYEEKGVRILQADDVLPRAYLTHTVEQISDGPTILGRLQDSGFDPRQSVILEEAPNDGDAGLLPPLASDGRWMPLSTTETLPEAAEVLTHEANQLTIRVTAQRPGVLVLSDTFYPAWRAYIDGRPAHIYRANYMFRAVVVPPGEHAVEMRYESTAFQVGLVVSAATLTLVAAGTCGLWVYAQRRRREQEASTSEILSTA